MPLMEAAETYFELQEVKWPTLHEFTQLASSTHHGEFSTTSTNI
jgi:hypothetical protein